MESWLRNRRISASGFNGLVNSPVTSSTTPLWRASARFRGPAGYAFAINGEINTADTYGSGILFRKLWSKLLDAAVLEAISESRRNTKKKTAPVTADSIQQWFSEADRGEVS